MVRSRSSSRKPNDAPQPSIESLIETILNECLRVSEMPLQDQLKELKDNFLPPLIPIGASHVTTSVAAIDALNELAEIFRSARPAEAKKISKDAFFSAASFAFGDTIAALRDERERQ